MSPAPVAPGPDALAHAVDVLRAGRLVAFPTETVYGLGANAEDVHALHRLYAVKGRPSDHPVIVHLATVTQLDAWSTHIPEYARLLADACWPGPLTLVLPRAARVPDAATGGLDTVGLRVPDHPVALALLDAFGGGIAAPSANRFGRVSPTTAAAVAADLGDEVDVVLDGGPCAVGVESTIVDASGAVPCVLRPGGVTLERLGALLGAPIALGGATRAPGTLAAHYAPAARVELVGAGNLANATADALAHGRRVGVLALSSTPVELPAGVGVLSAPETAEEYARVLYERLRDADRHHLDVLLVVPPPETGIGLAVADRLRRAAASSH